MWSVDESPRFIPKSVGFNRTHKKDLDTTLQLRSRRDPFCCFWGGQARYSYFGQVDGHLKNWKTLLYERFWLAKV